MGTSIMPIETVKPLVSPEQAAAEWALYEDLKRKLLNADDYQAIAGKKYIKRSGFRKIAVYFGLSDRILEQERTDREDKSFMWRIVVEAQAPNGRISVGGGVCDSRERKFAHVEHDVYATAHTRAKSRAISDMVAGGAVSAEEVQAGPAPQDQEGGGKGIGSLAELEYRLRENITDLGGTLNLVELAEGFRVEKVRYLDDQEFEMVNDIIKAMGGRWVSAGIDSHWIIPRG